MTTPALQRIGPPVLLAIDPGYTQSAWVEYQDGRPTAFGIEPNEDILRVIQSSRADTLAIESIASYGMAVGAEVFETALWSGRFIQRWNDRREQRPGPGFRGPFVPEPVHRVYRREVKLHLCGSMRAKDPNVRAALIDKYGPGKAKAVGLKASPGPLYGVKADVWAALGVAVTADETRRAA